MKELLGNIKGQNGENGIGVPEGGIKGQRLSKKTDNDFDTEWVDVNVIDYSKDYPNPDIKEDHSDYKDYSMFFRQFENVNYDSSRRIITYPNGVFNISKKVRTISDSIIDTGYQKYTNYSKYFDYYFYLAKFKDYHNDTITKEERDNLINDIMNKYYLKTTESTYIYALLISGNKIYLKCLNMRSAMGGGTNLPEVFETHSSIEENITRELVPTPEGGQHYTDWEVTKSERNITYRNSNYYASEQLSFNLTDIYDHIDLLYFLPVFDDNTKMMNYFMDRNKDTAETVNILDYI